MDKICPLMSRPHTIEFSEQFTGGDIRPLIPCQREKCQLWVAYRYAEKGIDSNNAGHCGLISAKE